MINNNTNRVAPATPHQAAVAKAAHQAVVDAWYDAAQSVRDAAYAASRDESIYRRLCDLRVMARSFDERDLARARIARGSDSAVTWDVALGGDGSDGEYYAAMGLPAGQEAESRREWKKYLPLLTEWEEIKWEVAAACAAWSAECFAAGVAAEAAVEEWAKANPRPRL